MGHKHLATTSRYLRPTERAAREVLNGVRGNGAAAASEEETDDDESSVIDA